jgi:hypothetical protein
MKIQNVPSWSLTESFALLHDIFLSQIHFLSDKNPYWKIHEVGLYAFEDNSILRSSVLQISEQHFLNMPGYLLWNPRYSIGGICIYSNSCYSNLCPCAFSENSHTRLLSSTNSHSTLAALQWLQNSASRWWLLAGANSQDWGSSLCGHRPSSRFSVAQPQLWWSRNSLVHLWTSWYVRVCSYIGNQWQNIEGQIKERQGLTKKEKDRNCKNENSQCCRSDQI